MNTLIEIHDSRIIEVISMDATVMAHFQPAYLHKSEGRPGIDPGTGWAQEARLIFTHASVSGDYSEWPCDLIDGELIVDGQSYPNSIPVPFETSQLTELRLVCDPVHTLSITSRGARLELIGEASYLEEFQS